MITKFTKFLNENSDNVLFQIPKEIEHFYDISGDFSNVKNWKAKIIEGNSLTDGKKKGDWDNVGYVMISLSSNYIIPIARSDEHHTGYDLLYDLIFDYKIKKLDYQSVYLLGTTFVYGEEYKEKELPSIKKAFEYGARNILVKEMGGGNSMDIIDYIENEGDFSKAKLNAKKLKKISTNGQKFIDCLLSIVEMFEQYKSNPLRQNPTFESRIIDACKQLNRIISSNDILWDILKWEHKDKEMYTNFEKAIKDGNIRTIDDSLFHMNGIKNTLHRLLKRKNKKLEEFFWSNENALEQFNAMSIVKM